MRLKATSLGLALLAFVLLVAVDVVIFRGMHDRDRLESKNSSEEVMNSLFASLRDHDDFGSAIESSEELRKGIVGLGVYAASGARIYSWGSTPESYSAPAATLPAQSQPIRYYLENRKNYSFILLLHPFRIPPPIPKERPADTAGARPSGGEGGRDSRPGDEHSFFFTTMKGAEVVYLEVRQPAYWAAEEARGILFPLTVILVGLLVFTLRYLVLRNAEYRHRIEEERSLVVLGTAASTLAHEIKNPLLSIRLQSSILARLYPEAAGRELGIINAEVERLSALTYRVNDYLREPLGRPEATDVAAVLREVSQRLAGSDLVEAKEGGTWLALIDPERLRSVAGNLLRNAIEAGGPEDGLAVLLSREDGAVLIDFLDRGPGVPKADIDRVFDPFFTTKSRGTGVGLAITKRFVEAARGHIEVGDREGGGCRVRVSLPATPEKDHS
jgi:two-component system sensor histidine kinase HydH